MVFLKALGDKPDLRERLPTVHTPSLICHPSIVREVSGYGWPAPAIPQLHLWLDGVFSTSKSCECDFSRSSPQTVGVPPTCSICPFPCLKARLSVTSF